MALQQSLSHARVDTHALFICMQAAADNANAVQPLTPTASAVLANSTTLPAADFDQPEPRADDPKFSADILSPWPLFKIFQKAPGMGAIEAARPFTAGALIAKFYGEVQTTPTMYTLQIQELVHVACSVGGPTYCNHSCNPNAFWDMTVCTARAPFPILTALRDIAQGEEITFNYNHTEWDMATPFSCLCGDATCLGKIQGFKHVDAETKKRYAPHITEFIAGKWRENEAQANSASA